MPRTEEDIDQAITILLWEGAKYGGTTFLATTTAVLIGNKRNPFIRKLPIPIKAGFVSSLTLATFYFGAEMKLVRMERERALSFSVVKPMMHNGELYTPPPPTQPSNPEEALALTWKDYQRWIIKNRFELVGGLWGLTALGTILYLWRKPIPVSDKLINARLYSQTLGLAAFFGFAAAAAVNEEEKEEKKSIGDYHFRQVVYGGEEGYKKEMAKQQVVVEKRIGN